MKVILHGTEIVCTDYDNAHINAELKDRDGNTISLFFDSVDDVERLAEELRFMAENIREREPKDFCVETGEVLV